MTCWNCGHEGHTHGFCPDCGQPEKKPDTPAQLISLRRVSPPDLELIWQGVEDRSDPQYFSEKARVPDGWLFKVMKMNVERGEWELMLYTHIKDGTDGK